MPGSADEPVLLNVTGEKVALGPHRRDLLPTYQRWINDFEVRVNLGGRVGPMTREAEEAWYEDVAKASGSVYFTIYEAATLRPWARPVCITWTTSTGRPSSAS